MTFISSTSKEQESNNFVEATKKNPKWSKAMQQELNTLEKK
jgi:hypothetical protein